MIIKRNLTCLLTALALVLAISCTKEENVELTPNSDSRVSFRASLPDLSGISVTKGMLDFKDVSTFLNTIDALEENEIEHDDEFMEQWGHLKEDALDDMEDELKFDPHKPYEDFEEQFRGFASLRKDIRDAEEKWLNNEELDEKSDPDNHFIFDDEIRAVLNQKAQVKIGRSLFQMTRFGYVEVTNGDYEMLAYIADNDASLMDVPTVVIHGGYYGSTGGSNTQNNNPPGDPTDCRTDIEDRNYYYPSSKRRLKGVQKLKGHSSIWGSKIKAKTKHYKKKRGRWKKRRGHITAQISDQSVNEYCELPNTESKSKTKNRRKVKVKIKAPAVSNHVYKTKYHELKTIHKKNSTTYTDYFYE